MPAQAAVRACGAKHSSFASTRRNRCKWILLHACSTRVSGQSRFQDSSNKACLVACAPGVFIRLLPLQKIECFTSTLYRPFDGIPDRNGSHALSGVFRIESAEIGI